MSYSKEKAFGLWMFSQKKIIGLCFFISHIVDKKLPWRHQFKKIRRGVYSVEKCIIVCSPKRAAIIPRWIFGNGWQETSGRKEGKER